MIVKEVLLNNKNINFKGVYYTICRFQNISEIVILNQTDSRYFNLNLVNTDSNNFSFYIDLDSYTFEIYGDISYKLEQMGTTSEWIIDIGINNTAELVFVITPI